MKKCFLGLLAIMSFTILGLWGCVGSKKQLTIFHTTDIHVRGILNTNLTYAQISGYVNDYKKKHPNTLFVDSGDAVQGLSFSDISQGMNMIQVMNLMGYDAMALGNHEFDFGANNVLDMIQNATFPILAANFFQGNEQVAPPFVTYNIDGIHVTIVGIVTPDVEKLVPPHLIKGFRFPDPITMLETMVPELRETSDIILVVSHLGGIGDVSSIELAKRVPGIDVIIDGHDHIPLPDGLMVGETLIVNAGEYAEYLGRIDLTLDKHKIIRKKATLLTPKNLAQAPQNTEISDLITSLTAEHQVALEKIRGPVIATLPEILDGHRTSVRKGETVLTNLLTDAIYAQSRTDIVFISSGGIRTSLPSGPITGEDIYNVMPFGDQIVTIEVSGQELKAALEHGLSHYPKTAGAFPQFAGMRVVVDAKQPAGSRIVQVMINEKPLESDMIYSMATSTYLQGGGDGYDMLKKRVFRTIGTQKDIFTKYLIEKIQETDGLKTSPRLVISKD